MMQLIGNIVAVLRPMGRLHLMFICFPLVPAAARPSLLVEALLLPSRMVASMVGASKAFMAGDAVNGVSQNKFLQVVLVSPQSGSDASIVAEVLEVENNSTQKMRTMRIPPVLTVNKTASYAVYELTFIRHVPVKTRKYEPDAGADVVQICERQVTSYIFY